MTNPIYITGCPRSGTTWVGKVMGLDQTLGYIHEPFNQDHNLGRLPRHLPENYYYLTSKNDREIQPWINGLLRYKYYPFKGVVNNRGIREKGAHIKEWMRFIRYRKDNKRPLIKDPVGIFSTPWFAREYNVLPIILIRHPAAVISSFLRLNWNIRFDGFVNQPSLIKDWMSEFESELTHTFDQSQSPIARGVLLWKLVYSTVEKYQSKYKNWMFVRHEDLSREPLEEFRKLYHYAGLNFNDDIQSKIYEMTEGTTQSEVPSNANAMYIKVNSRQNIYNWKKRLNSEQISYIKSHLEPWWRPFYSDDDW